MENDITEIQEKINNLYFKAFKNYSGNLNLSVPHIPKVSENYLLNRTIVLGQETNTWYPGGIEDGLKNIFLANPNSITKVCIIDRYKEFIVKSAEKYGRKFWEFNKSLYTEKILAGKMISNDDLCHCWMNLFAVEACKNKADNNGRPTKNAKLAA